VQPVSLQGALTWSKTLERSEDVPDGARAIRPPVLGQTACWMKAQISLG